MKTFRLLVASTSIAVLSSACDSSATEPGGTSGSAGAAGRSAQGGSAGHAIDGPTVACDTCFAVEDIADDVLRAEAERLLLAGLDGESLHTLDGVRRPLSVLTEEAITDDARRATLSSIADVLFCTARLSTFVHASEGRIALVVARHDAVRAVVSAHPEVFAALALTADATSASVYAAVVGAPSPRKEAGLAALHGYPADVVAAALAGKSEEGTALPLPTFERPHDGLAYRAPAGADASVHEALWIGYRDLVLSYSKKRGSLLGVLGESPGAMVRTFLADRNGVCSPESAAASLVTAVEKPGHCVPLEDACSGDFSCCSLTCQPSGLCEIHTPLTL